MLRLAPGAVAARAIFTIPLRTSMYLPSDSPETFKARRVLNKDWKKRQRVINKAKQVSVPEEFTRYEEKFDKVITFEQQMASLAKRGFLRAYKGYEPPSDMEDRFMSVCSKHLSEVVKSKADRMADVVLGNEDKGRLLMALEKEFNHSVPNSLVHTIRTLDHAFRFYSANVDSRTPYEKLHEDSTKGKLPPNLHIQLEPKRFDPDGDHQFDKVTAFPRSSTIIVSPEARKKYKDVIAEGNPWKNAFSD